MLAWKHYVQASLHFWPRMYYQLFAYQKNFCRLTTKYMFEACYNYDRDFRLLQASQTSLKAEWDVVHPELVNMHIQADSKLPVCFHCRSNGHYATNCPSKQPVLEPVGRQGNTFRDASASNLQLPFRSTTTNHNTGHTIEQTRYSVNRNPQARGPCSRYNRGTFCSKPPCQFTHATNVTKVMAGVNVNTSLTLPSFLRHSNPLPVQITINIDMFKNILYTHPDQELVRLYNGFDIGFNGTTHTIKPKNLKSAGSNESRRMQLLTKSLPVVIPVDHSVIPQW